MFTLEATAEKVLVGILLVVASPVLLVASTDDEWGRGEGLVMGFTGMMLATANSGLFLAESTFIWFGKSRRDIPCIIRVI